MIHRGAELRRLMFSLSTLEELGEVLSARTHFRENIRTALWSLKGTVPVSRGVLFLHDARRRSLALEAVRGVRAEPGPAVPLPESAALALRRLPTDVRPPALMANRTIGWKPR